MPHRQVSACLRDQTHHFGGDWKFKPQYIYITIYGGRLCQCEIFNYNTNYIISPFTNFDFSKKKLYKVCLTAE